MISPEQFVESLTITAHDSVQELPFPPVVVRFFVVRRHSHIDLVAENGQKGSISIEPYSTLRATNSESDDINTVHDYAIHESP